MPSCCCYDSSCEVSTVLYTLAYSVLILTSILKSSNFNACIGFRLKISPNVFESEVSATYQYGVEIFSEHTTVITRIHPLGFLYYPWLSYPRQVGILSGISRESTSASAVGIERTLTLVKFQL